MEQTAAAPVRLSLRGQTYVAAVAVAATVAFVVDSSVAWVVLLVLTLPLSLLAMWVGFYAALAVGALVGHGPEAVSWPVGVAWVAVWTTTAWINARLAEKVLRRGWDALRTAPRKEDDDDWSEDWYGDADDRPRP
ncbi:hypothetical protein ASG49_03235 [Marmoricola sp. Leaf446]|uniref:hypothetical protein n=1 Tax=Marmoricola sp. Leaf446 TaxID=1736379 RepID=UPI0006F49772|nr:hypothetical protein [Marmoricola sp. Leaf446]KQT93971.1 hypothetical protein ASG49_03235 [Marmoricola sp. Leaf446]